MTIYERALEHYGVNNQRAKVIEELEELKKELIIDHFGTGDREHIIEELADVYNVLEYVKLIYGVRVEELHGARYQKLERLERRMER